GREPADDPIGVACGGTSERGGRNVSGAGRGGGIERCGQEHDEERRQASRPFSFLFLDPTDARSSPESRLPGRAGSSGERTTRSAGAAVRRGDERGGPGRWRARG